MTELLIKKGNQYEYMEYKGVILKYEHVEEKGYGEYDSFDMNPSALKGPTIVCHTYKIGEVVTTHVHDIVGPSRNAPFPKFYARDCLDENGFEIIKKYPNSEERIGIVSNI